MSVDVKFFFSFLFEIVSYFENIPSLQSRSIGLIVAHLTVSIFKGKFCVGQITNLVTNNDCKD